MLGPVSVGPLGRIASLLGGVAGVTLCVLGFAQAAQATELVLPKGEVAKVTSVKFNACNNLSYGYQLDGGGALIKLAAKPSGCGSFSAPASKVGPFPAQHVLRFFLADETCGYAFYSDGSAGSSEHASVSGSNPYAVGMWDGGGLCEYPPGAPDPHGAAANFEATVTIAPPPSPEPPEFGRCIKIGGKAGKYSNGGCTKNVPGSKTEKEFEWFPGPGSKNKFTASAGPNLFYETTSGYAGTCEAMTGAGEYLRSEASKFLAATLTWTGCKVVASPEGLLNGEPCQNGGKAGEIITSVVSEANWENKAKKKTALLLSPPSGSTFVFFECGGIGFEVVAHGRGVLVNVANGSMKLKEVLKFKQTAGIQEPSTWHLGEAGVETTYLETVFSTNHERSAMAIEMTIKKEEKLELNGVV